jgi:hypothetical protein
MTAPNIQQIRAAIAAKIRGITGAGVVHTYERYAKTMGGLKALYLAPDSGVLRGWHVRRVTTVEHQLALGRYAVDHHWQLRGLMALDDARASEESFDLLVEQIRDAFRADDTLDGLIATMIDDQKLAGLQVEESGPVMFAGEVLCHAVRCGLQTRHFR